ncbi:redox-sensing transcriptional repressor Rex [Lignipirellula cremea]|uniref:Redox-sensing transcriptional repressor Rex n=1 Tax=Lignipirellula cremea TaxID=2528010 RepID=A0A518DML7_9BACT|nr:redox-sensing transcriptional repressor Rex [Lignipirellula cremea]QDU93079.1 Redox-sensing transcriptional repressor Rex [Lignipirellula cremea]
MASSKEKGSSPEPPKAVVIRLSLYLRELQHLVREGIETTSSTQLGSRLGFSDAQVRKDLAYFGQFGRPGIGYPCAELIDTVRGILGADRSWPIALVGAGNLGRALLRYKGFSQRGFDIVAAFDTDPGKIGGKLEAVPIYSLEDLPAVAREKSIQLGIIATPVGAAQQAADQLVAAGVAGILNFAPLAISLPDHVRTSEVDLAIELEQLSFAVVNSTIGKIK